jgi:hypothetical protein
MLLTVAGRSVTRSTTLATWPLLAHALIWGTRGASASATEGQPGVCEKRVILPSTGRHQGVVHGPRGAHRALTGPAAGLTGPAEIMARKPSRYIGGTAGSIRDELAQTRGGRPTDRPTKPVLVD